MPLQPTVKPCRPNNHGGRLPLRTAAAGLALILAAAVSACGCHSPRAEALPPQVFDLCAQERWGEAIPLLKERLREDAGDAVAHYLYGTAYAHGDEFYPGLVEGELRMALALVESGAGTGDETPAQFKLNCYLELCDLHLGMLRLMTAIRANAAVQRAAYQRFATVVEQARAIDPQNARLAPFEEARKKFAPR